MNENGISSINGLGSILEFLLTYHYVKCVGSDPESYYSTTNVSLVHQQMLLIAKVLIYFMAS